VRREVLIRRAEAAADVLGAARLREGRSRRHIARDEWLAARAAAGGQSNASADVALLRERFEALTEARADVTADEGAYPAAWDRDEEEVAELRQGRRQSLDAELADDTASGGRRRGVGLTNFFQVATRAVVNARQAREDMSMPDASASSGERETTTAQR